MDIEDKIKSMKASDFLEVMIKGIEREWVKLDFSSFGYSKPHGNEGIVCFGCAATNAFCELIQEPFAINEINLTQVRADKVGIPFELYDIIELAFDALRRGDIIEVNDCFSYTNINIVFPKPNVFLVNLINSSYHLFLPDYKEYLQQLKDSGL